MSVVGRYQDGYQTWAMQIARNVSADFMVEAVSGFGVEPSTPAIQVRTPLQKPPRAVHLVIILFLFGEINHLS